MAATTSVVFLDKNKSLQMKLPTTVVEVVVLLPAVFDALHLVVLDVVHQVKINRLDFQVLHKNVLHHQCRWHLVNVTHWKVYKGIKI